MMIAKIDKQQMSMIALAIDPTREPDRSADVAKAQLGAGVGAIGMHREVDPLAQNVVEKAAPRFTGANPFVNPRGRR